MTSTTGLDEPDMSESDTEDEQPAAAAAAGAGPSLPVRGATKSENRSRKSEEEKAARAQAVQAEVLQARSMGGPADWDEDWVTNLNSEVVQTKSEPVMQVSSREPGGGRGGFVSEEQGKQDRPGSSPGPGQTGQFDV